jgi:peptide/nickel transport system permease protein
MGTSNEAILELRPRVRRIIRLPGSRSATRTSKRRMPLSAKIAGGVIVLIVLAAIFAPLLTSYGPNDGNLADALKSIGSPGHLLGTDGEGRDILTRILYGGRLSLLTGLIPVLVAGSIGTTLGIGAGLGRRSTHSIVMRTLDVLYAFPAVLLAIAIASALGPGISNAIIALAIIMIPPIARIAESETRQLRSADFLEAARASGASKVSIASRQVLPNIAPAVVVYCTALIGLSIVYAAGLSYLGLGVTPPTAEWGSMTSDLQEYILTSPQLLLVPAMAILITSIAFNVLGDGLRSWLNVRSEAP